MNATYNSFTNSWNASQITMNTTCNYELFNSTLNSSTSSVNTSCYSFNNTLDVNSSTNANVFKEEFIVDFRKYYKYGFEFILYGYFMPVWSLMSIIMYSLMITVFLKYGMTTKTHVCLIAIAVCDSVSPIAPTTIWVYFFAIKKNYYYLPFEWCRTYHYTTEVIPQLFTYTSYFITVMMTVQRYIMVVHPFKADKLCSKTIVYIMIAMCFLASVSIRFIHFFHYGYVNKTVPAKDNSNETMQACGYGPPDWMTISFYKYLGILFVIQTVVVGIIPCTVLVVAELLMVKAISARSAKRKQMISKSNNKTRNMKSEKRLTVATIFITAVTLFYMVPVVVIQVIDVLALMFDVTVGDYNDIRTAIVILNVIYWMCIPSNFIITCCLSSEFRSGIRRLFIKPEMVQTSTISTVTVTTKAEHCNEIISTQCIEDNVS